MAFNELERKRIEKALDRFLEKERPPAHIRLDLDLAYRISGQSVELLEIRPNWRNPNEKMERPYAKCTFVRSKNLWNIYWQRANLKWLAYEPAPIADSIDDFLKVVKSDEYGCFYG